MLVGTGIMNKIYFLFCFAFCIHQIFSVKYLSLLSSENKCYFKKAQADEALCISFPALVLLGDDTKKARS